MQEAIQIKFSKEGMMVLNAVIAFILYGISLSIKEGDFAALRKHWKSAVTGMVSQLVLMPFVTFLLILAIKPSPYLAMGMILVCACPGGNVSNFITYLAGGNVPLGISLTALSTILAVFFTPFNVALYGGLYEPSSVVLRTVTLSFTEMLQTIVTLMVIPLSLGALTRKYLPVFAEKASRIVQKISVGLLWLFIIFAFAGNAKTFIDNIHLVFGIVVLHNGLCYLTGFLTAVAMRLPREDIKTLTIETGIHNAGLGLILIFNFFDGNGMMALVAAAWGVWHLLSGWIVAMMFKKLKY